MLGKIILNIDILLPNSAYFKAFPVQLNHKATAMFKKYYFVIPVLYFQYCWDVLNRAGVRNYIIFNKAGHL